MRKCTDVNDERIRTILGNLDVLSRSEVRDLEALLRSLNSVDHYAASLVPKKYGKATFDDCARSAAKNLDALVIDRHKIRGLGGIDSAKINQRLARLTPNCQNFVLKQPLSDSADRLRAAIANFLSSPMVEPDFAGAAFRKVLVPAPVI